jgi:3-dehydroquinate dehydratase/shikimate dehydrogenase
VSTTWLREAQQLGAEFVDVEWRAGFSDVVQERGGRGVVLSLHDFDGVPADLGACAQAMRRSGAAVIKIAVTATRLSDNLALLPLARDAAAPTVIVAMGEAGIPSRILASRFGSNWTYAGDAVAPGQLPMTRMRDEFSFFRISSATAIYGVVGRPVLHSLSPAMHNAAFKATGRDAVYLPLAAADYDDFVTFAEALSLAGASVTAPFKLDACSRADECDSVSRRIGSVNTLRRVNGRWAARNTDIAGFLAPLEARLPLRGARATVLGAGGAARAVAEALTSAGASVAVAARRRERAEAVAQLTRTAVADWPPQPGSWDVLINATPLGTTPRVDESPLPDGPFTGQLVYDLAYNPRETLLLRQARRAGLDTIGGLEMLVAQAQLQFEWWTGIKPPARVMREAADTALAAPQGAQRAATNL